MILPGQNYECVCKSAFAFCYAKILNLFFTYIFVFFHHIHRNKNKPIKPKLNEASDCEVWGLKALRGLESLYLTGMLLFWGLNLILGSRGVCSCHTGRP